MLRPLTIWLAKHGVTANQVTLFAVTASIAFGASLAISDSIRLLLLLPPFLFFRMALNAIDGMLAREHGQQSRLGAILNETTDVISDAVLYLPFAMLPDTNPALVVLVVFLAVISEMTGILGLTIGASRRYDGPLGKSDRAFLFGLLGLLLGLGVPLGSYLDATLVLAAFLLVVTSFRRARLALEEGV